MELSGRFFDRSNTGSSGLSWNKGHKTCSLLLVLSDDVIVTKKWNAAVFKTAIVDAGEKVELVLDYIVERKRMDDLADSIVDGRFREQKVVSHTVPLDSSNNSNPPPHHNRFTALFPGPPGWAGARRELLDFMVQGKINRGRQTDGHTTTASTALA